MKEQLFGVVGKREGVDVLFAYPDATRGTSRIVNQIGNVFQTESGSVYLVRTLFRHVYEDSKDDRGHTVRRSVTGQRAINLLIDEHKRSGDMGKIKGMGYIELYQY